MTNIKNNVRLIGRIGSKRYQSHDNTVSCLLSTGDMDLHRIQFSEKLTGLIGQVSINDEIAIEGSLRDGVVEVPEFLILGGKDGE